MRFLADESRDFSAVRALRSAGHDVVAIAEVQQRSVDREVIDLAQAQQRVLLTEDKDFGWLAFVANLANPGVILIRFPASARSALADSVLQLVSKFGAKLSGAFVVLQPGSVRISKPPRKAPRRT